MADPTIVSTIEYDVLALDQNEAEMLRAELSEFGPVRLRRAFKERGGDWTTLWVVLTFVGLEYTKGIITKLAEGHATRLQEKIQRVFKKDNNKLLPQQCVRVSLSFDDIDLSVNLPRDNPSDFLPDVLVRVHQHLNMIPLRDSNPRAIVIPFEWSEDGWQELTEFERSDDAERYWGIGEHDCPAVSAIYDSRECRVLDYFERPAV